MEEIEQMMILKELGLTEGESKVYILLLKKEALKVAQISNKTNLNRSNLYKVLESLIGKKLVFSSLIKKTKYFSATRPERIKELYRQKVSELKEKEKEVENLVSGIEKLSISSLPESEFGVEVYEGVNEIKQIIENVLNLKKNEIVYAIGKEGLLAEYPGIRFWFDNFIKRRIKSGIKFIAVYNLHKNVKSAKSALTKIKYANLSGMGEIEISFYNNTMLIYVITKEKPRVILIKSKEIVNSMISYFNFLWEKAKEL